MKDRAFWYFVGFAVLALAAAYWWRNRIPPATAPGAAANVTAPAGATAKNPKAEVAIQDGKTIDFSSGVAVVKDDAKQKAVIDKSVKEMDSAAKDVTFGPPLQKKAEPTPAPPKP